MESHRPNPSSASDFDVDALLGSGRIGGSDRDLALADLARFPADVLVRGIFFEGLSRAIEERCGADAVQRLFEAAGVSSRAVAFKQYPHRDFYKLYYGAAKLLHPELPFPRALCAVAQRFYPIFEASLLGRTMSAFTGKDPVTLLNVLCKAYGVSVKGNEHGFERMGEREGRWFATVEPVSFYADTFEGIVLGALSARDAANAAVEVLTTSPAGTRTRWEFRLRW